MVPNFPPKCNAPKLGALEEYKILPGWQKKLQDSKLSNVEFCEVLKIALEESAKGVDTM